MKKMCKYIKKIFSAILIIAIVSPSYASIVSNDGSAFITKGEFDSAFTEFNSRLTTFEAGVNSKIDSQVTSYLDRNGIWNGRTQDLVKPWYYFSVLSGVFGLSGNGYYSDSPFNFSGTSLSWYRGSGEVNTSYSSESATVYYSPAVLNKTAQDTVVESLSKTGLLYIDFNVTFASQFGSYKVSCSESNRHPLLRWLYNVNSPTGSASTTGFLTESWYNSNKNVPRLHKLNYYQDEFINMYDQLWITSNYKSVGNSGVKYQYGVEVQINGEMMNRQVVDQNYTYRPVLNGYKGNSNYTLPWAMMGETGVLRYTCSFFVRKGDKLSFGPYVLALGRHSGGVLVVNRESNSGGYWVMGADFNDLKVY